MDKNGKYGRQSGEPGGADAFRIPIIEQKDRYNCGNNAVIASLTRCKLSLGGNKNDREDKSEQSGRT